MKHIESLKKKDLSQIAWGKILKSILTLVIACTIFIPIGSVGIFGIYITAFLVNLYMMVSIGNIPCPKCLKPYGVEISIFRVVKIPDHCVYCRAKAE